MIGQISLMRELSIKTDSKIIMLVLDGLGGLEDSSTGKTELEISSTPNLDFLSSKSICGLLDPVAPGITPGSAPGHLGLFGYNPLEYQIGRGILEALGINFHLKEGDIAARGNLCTLDSEGIITDRRANRISTEKSLELASILDGMEIEGTKIIIRVVKDHRLIAVFRGAELSDEITDSDPQKNGLKPVGVQAHAKQAEKTANIVNEFSKKAQRVLADKYPANGLVLRGFSRKPNFPVFDEIYKLNACAIASYPMYRGLANVVGMDTIQTGTTFSEQIDTLQESIKDYDYFFVHYKDTDAAGEDGNFQQKVQALEDLDRFLPRIISMQPDVLVITGDHSTPATLGGHSWHPVPVMLLSKHCRSDNVNKFTEKEFLNGGLGRISAAQLMPIIMANAMKLKKYGA